MQSKLIFLVEDNPDDADLTRRALVKSGVVADVVLARDGEEALALIDSAASAETRIRDIPDIVLLDLKMPKVDGFEVLRRVKSTAALKSVPVVVLTSSGEERDIAESYRLGANSYIQKPVDFEEFGETMKQVGRYWLSINWSLKRFR